MGVFELGKNPYFFLKIHPKEPETINNVQVPYPSEISNHKCVMVHHKNPYTKLGPFKIEYLHHNPFFLIIHDLLTEEDMAYLKDWATPRLSRKRYISDSSHVRIVAKSVQERLFLMFEFKIKDRKYLLSRFF